MSKPGKPVASEKKTISGSKNLANPPSMAQLSGVKTEGTHQNPNQRHDTIEESDQIPIESSAPGSSKRGDGKQFTYEKLASPEEDIDENYKDDSYSAIQDSKGKSIEEDFVLDEENFGK